MCAHACAAEDANPCTQSLGFSNYVPEINAAYEEHKTMQREREKKASRRDASGLSEEELLRQQEALFEQARLKYLAHTVHDVPATP